MNCKHREKKRIELTILLKSMPYTFFLKICGTKNQINNIYYNFTLILVKKIAKSIYIY